jgi:Uma2 family endonuclease
MNRFLTPPKAFAMATVTTHEWTISDLHEHFGAIPFSRIRQSPPPGSATPQDVVDIAAREEKLYELIDGVLVQKPMGFYEGYLTALIGRLVGVFVATHKLGIVTGPDASIMLHPNQVRIPDVSFISWDRLPDRKIPTEPAPTLVPNLAVEVISKSNTKVEMSRKLNEYFETGVELVWYVYPDTQTLSVYTGPSELTELTKTDSLNGGDVLAGFSLSLEELFARSPDDD